MNFKVNDKVMVRQNYVFEGKAHFLAGKIGVVLRVDPETDFVVVYIGGYYEHVPPEELRLLDRPGNKAKRVEPVVDMSITTSGHSATEQKGDDMPKFKVGDRVSGVVRGVRRVGTIKFMYPNSSTTYAVEFDEDITGHCCVSTNKLRTKDNHGWWVHEVDLSLIEAKPVESAPAANVDPDPAVNIAWFKKRYPDIDTIIVNRHSAQRRKTDKDRPREVYETVTTVVKLKDGRKGVVRKREGEPHDVDKGILYAYVKAMITPLVRILPVKCGNCGGKGLSLSNTIPAASVYTCDSCGTRIKC